MISKQNSKVQLTGERKIFLNKIAFEAGNHPNQRVKKIRYHYQQKQMRKIKIKATKGNGYQKMVLASYD